MLYLLALKIKYPYTVFMLRGNHECRMVSGYFGFKRECEEKYGLAVYNRFMLCFDQLPLSAVLTTNYGRFLCMHGGLSPDVKYVDV